MMAIRPRLIQCFVASSICAACTIGCSPSRHNPVDEILVGVPRDSGGNPLRIVAWDIQSEDSDVDYIAAELADFPDDHVFCLTDVAPGDFVAYLQAANRIDDRDFESIEGTTGDSERIQVIFDSNRLKLLDFDELSIDGGNDVELTKNATPLIARFRDLVSGKPICIAICSFRDVDEKALAIQANSVREWANEIPPTEGIVVIGNLGLAYDISMEKGGASFDELSRADVLKWISPQNPIDTQFTDNAPVDGVDDFPNTIQDGVFLGGAAKNWNATVRVIWMAGKYPDDNRTSDHRPIWLVLSIP